MNGELGKGDSGAPTGSAVPVAVQMPSGRTFVSVDAGATHSLAIADDGNAYAWGNGANGRLGVGDTVLRSTPVLVGAGSPLDGKAVTAVSAGFYHSMGLTADGKVYSWGYDNLGQLGDGAGPTERSVPVELGGDLTDKVVTHIHTGQFFSVATTEDNKVFTWGTNSFGCLAGAIPFDMRTDLPTEADFSSALSGDKVILGLACGLEHSIMISGPPPLPSPEIVVEPVQNGTQARIANGDTVNFGTNAVGTSNSIYFVVRNTGKSALSDISVTLDGTNETDFYSAFTLSALLPGDSTGFYVFFYPQNAGLLTANVHISSNDPKNSPFNIKVEGNALAVGSTDASFTDPGIDNAVNTTAVQADGKIIIGGSFTNVGVFSRNHIARLNDDGTLDTGFDANGANADGEVNCILVQPDGKIVISGSFLHVGGVARNGIARLNPDGTLDGLFDPNATGQILSMALQNDGKIVVAGDFSDIGTPSTGRSLLARLETDGSVDTGFNPTVSDTVRSVALLTDGRIIIGGSFQQVGGSTHNCIARLEENGAVDNEFAAQISPGSVLSVAVMPDGRVLAGGSFTTVNSTARNRLARMKTDGSLETDFFDAFDPDVDGAVTSIAVRTNGEILSVEVLPPLAAPRPRMSPLLAHRAYPTCLLIQTWTIRSTASACRRTAKFSSPAPSRM